MSKYRVRVEQDDHPESPREWDNLGTLAAYHRRYNLSDEGAPVDVEGARYIEESDQYLSLPVYLYDHSILSVSTKSFVGRAHHAEWDSGKLGIIYVSKADVRKEYNVKRITKKIEESVYRVLNGEIETYDQFLRGDVWGYIVEKEKVYTAEDGDTITRWEHVDSCWGFYGREEVEAEGQSILESYQEDEKNTKVSEGDCR